MAAPLSWDIFCRVVDNFGDIGVCWRLSRQLATGQGGTVRLWVDDVASLQALCPQADAAADAQHIEGVEVCRWDGEFSAVTPAQVVIEGFGCGLPDAYVAAMVSRKPQTLWIILEYLSAEPWVSGHHGLPSPHPRWPLERYFFFPGFVAGTGGLLSEAGLLERRAAFGANECRQLWADLGFGPPAAQAAVVSLFAYENAPVADLLSTWEHGQEPTVVAVPQGRIVGPVLNWLGVTAECGVGHSFQRGALEVRLVPFVSQLRYDQLLWACDCNLVRGEDSFVRAQWAGKPMIWQPYPQQDQAHWPKLEAFLDLYCAGLPRAAADAVRTMWRSWNGVGNDQRPLAAAWRDFQAQRIELGQYAPAWAEKLAEAGELSEMLAQFCQDKLKYRF